MTHEAGARNPVRGRASALVLALVALLAARADAQSSPPPATDHLTHALDAVFAAHRIPGARIGVRIVQATTGRVLFERDADLPLNPASNTKIITASAALALVGADHRFVTRVHGRVSGDRVTGDLWLVGGGDPSLRTADLWELARRIAARGVRAVSGDVVVDDRAYGGEQLPPSFEQQPNETAPFRAMVSAASVDENAITVRVDPGDSVGSPAHVSVDPPGYAVIDSTVTTGSAHAGVHVELSTEPLRDDRERVRVRGTIGLDVDEASFRERLSHPSRATAEAFRAALEANGIRVSGSTRIGPLPSALPVLASHSSDTLANLLDALGRDSNNFYAEMVLLAIAADDAHGPATFAHGVERELAWMHDEGIATDRVQLRNGSGLFAANSLSAGTLADVLRAAYRDPDLRDEFVSQLAVAGESGTLRRRLHLPGASRRVRAKSGTLDDVIALSGYVLGRDLGDTFVFSFVANGVRGHHAEARALADGIVAALVAEP